jgi:predicted  nucleic acid-binding Zn-ribbon protein
MSDTVSNELIYELLKRMNVEFARMREDMSDIKVRIGSLEEHVGAIVVSIAAINHRLDRHDDRFNLIEKRLGLIDA